MKKFKIYNVYTENDRLDMESEISGYLTDGYTIEKLVSNPKRDIDKKAFTEYSVILSDES